MREAEIAALSAEFFEPEFDHARALVMLGTPVGGEQIDGRTVTYLRPDARSLARVEVFARPDPSGGAGAAFIEDVVVVLRGARVYSRAALEDVLGPSRKVAGPVNEDGEPSWQLEFPQSGTLPGRVLLRWWPEASDHPAMGDEGGPDPVRVEEVHLQRTRSGSGHEVPSPRGSRRPPSPMPFVDLDEAMDAGAWLADLAWRVLRPDFSLTRAEALFGARAGSSGRSGLVTIVPADPRLSLAIVAIEGEDVASVHIDAAEGMPIQLAPDAVADRLNTLPIFAEGVVRYRFEATRSRGSVTLVLAPDSPPAGPIVAVVSVEIVRE